MTADRRPDEVPSAVDPALLRDREALVGLAHSIVADRHEAEDVVQDALAAVLARISTIDHAKRAAYLREAVRRNAIKRRVRKREHPAAAALIESVQAREASNRAWQDPLDLEEAIESLPLVQQAVLRMKYYAGLTFREIGQSLSISTNTAASRCRYALEKLRIYLDR